MSLQRGILRPKQQQNRKIWNTCRWSLFCTGQASVHPQRIRACWRRKKKKGGLEKRQECISTSLSFAFKTRERLSSVSKSNPTRTGAGAWEQFLGHALLSPCPLLPCCQEGETARRKGGRKRNHEITKLCSYTLLLKLWNPCGICIKESWHWFWGEVTDLTLCEYTGAVPWIVDYVSSNRHLSWLLD